MESEVGGRLIDGVYFAGGASNCVRGAFNEYQAHGGGEIIQIAGHAYFIAPGVESNDTVGNLGVEYDANGRVMTDQFYYPITVKEARSIGRVITQDVLKFIPRKKR